MSAGALLPVIGAVGAGGYKLAKSGIKLGSRVTDAARYTRSFARYADKAGTAVKCAGRKYDDIKTAIKTALKKSDGAKAAGKAVGKSGKNLNINDKPLYRVMSEVELDVVKSTGMLRGGRVGTTYFTDSYFKNAKKAKSRLALPQKPSYILEFEIKNNPNISGGTRVDSAFGEKGGGREYFTEDIVEVFIVNYQKMIGGQ